jgi:mono/diheme cytochrome c family protein
MKKCYPPLLVVGLLCLSGCRQDMAAQPRYNPLQASPVWDDNRSARPLEPGTVPRGQMRLDNDFYEGQRVFHLWGRDFIQELKEIPIPVTMELLERGQDRFNIMCTMCHDRVGTGNGKVVQRGFLKPPSYHSERLRAMPDGHIFQVITRGQGGMPAFSDQITPRDRWAIVSYVRALQLSQHFTPTLTEAEHKQWEEAGKPKEGGEAKEGHP